MGVVENELIKYLDGMMSAEFCIDIKVCIKLAVFFAISDCASLEKKQEARNGEAQCVSRHRCVR